MLRFSAAHTEDPTRGSWTLPLCSCCVHTQFLLRSSTVLSIMSWFVAVKTHYSLFSAGVCVMPRLATTKANLFSFVLISPSWILGHRAILPRVVLLRSVVGFLLLFPFMCKPLPRTLGSHRSAYNTLLLVAPHSFNLNTTVDQLLQISDP